MEIRDVVLEAENIIDSATTGGGDYDFSTQLKSIRKEMEAIITTCQTMSGLEWWSSKLDDTTHPVRYFCPQVDDIIYSFEDGKPLEIISIVGLPGIGKTTVAEEIYNDDHTKERFEIRAWIKVSQGFKKRDLLTGLLESISKQEMETDTTEDESLGKQLFEQLLDHKYLIVMDGICNAQTLFDLRAYLPDQCDGSKIIVTTRESMVAKAIQEEQDYFESSRVHQVDPLSEEDSWKLFKRKLLGQQTRDLNELEELGMLMVKACHGVPLAIAGLCGLLYWKEKTPSSWRSAANELATLLKGYMEENLICRYDQLLPHLKACLLYIGSFSRYHIPVRDLILLLVAEGIVNIEVPGDEHNNNDNIIAPILPEVVAEGYISDLVDTCLVMVSSKSICGATKKCYVFSMMREFFSEVGKEVKFVTQIDDPREAYTKTSLQHFAPSLRDVDYVGCRKDWNWAFRVDDLKLLKVLDILPIEIDFPWEIGVMVHLTYLAVQCKVLPESITNLFNLETLILSNDRVIYLPPGILKMVKLRCVRNKNGGVLCFANSGIAADSGLVDNLQTVYPICDCNTCRLIFTKCPRIRKLSLFHSLCSGFRFLPNNLSVLEHLETLKCSYHNNYSYFSQTKVIPEWDSNFKLKLAGSIKRLTLKWTFLRWEMISILGTLPNLEVLKLLNNACVKEEDVESCWDTSEQEFPRLKCLKMQNLDIIKWVDNNHAGFKRLEIFLIDNCPLLAI